jgi:hypothetical protein
MVGNEDIKMEPDQSVSVSCVTDDVVTGAPPLDILMI